MTRTVKDEPKSPVKDAKVDSSVEKQSSRSTKESLQTSSTTYSNTEAVVRGNCSSGNGSESVSRPVAVNGRYAIPHSTSTERHVSLRATHTTDTSPMHGKSLCNSTGVRNTDRDQGARLPAAIRAADTGNGGSGSSSCKVTGNSGAVVLEERGDMNRNQSSSQQIPPLQPIIQPPQNAEISQSGYFFPSHAIHLQTAAQPAIHAVNSTSEYWQDKHALAHQERVLQFPTHSNGSQFQEFQLLKSPYETTFFDSSQIH